VQITCDAGALSDALLQAYVEYPRDLTQAQLIQPPHHNKKGGDARRPKPIGLPVRRRNGEIERRALLVPHAAVVAGHDLEAVVTGRKIV